MNILEIIEKKKRKQALSSDEIAYFVEHFTAGDLPDYQASALLMAITLNGMNDEEIFSLTEAMLHSGGIMDMSAVKGHVVDKHSTGGVGDTVTLILAPLLACCGVYVAKMSGRGLSFTGGTLDKLESIPGFDVNLPEEEFFDVVDRVGCCVVGQTADLVPADKKMYALRDVTGTVDSIPLIAASIMSKKLASGSDTILLDVKYGSGAFMKTAKQALELAKKMVAIGTRAGKNVGAMITDMSQPLSSHIGNALEVVGAVAVLKGERNRLAAESAEIAVRILTLTGLFDDAAAKFAVQTALASGAALEKFKEMVAAQHGDVYFAEHPEELPLGEVHAVYAVSDGFVTSIKTAELGNALTALGGGRLTKGEDIDRSVGLVLHVQLGDKVKKGDLLCDVYHNGGRGLQQAAALVKGAVKLGALPPEPHKTVYAYVDKTGVQTD